MWGLSRKFWKYQYTGPISREFAFTNPIETQHIWKAPPRNSNIKASTESLVGSGALWPEAGGAGPRNRTRSGRAVRGRRFGTVRCWENKTWTDWSWVGVAASTGRLEGGVPGFCKSDRSPQLPQGWSWREDWVKKSMALVSEEPDPQTTCCLSRAAGSENKMRT